MAKVPRKDVLPYKAHLLTLIADREGITGAELLKLYPPTERTTVYRFLRILREEELISVENLSSRQYAHTITPAGKKWLHDTGQHFRDLSKQILAKHRDNF